MDIDGFLVLPAVNQQDRFRIVQWLAVFIPQVPGFRPDGSYGAAGSHLFGKLPGISVFPGVADIYSNGHILPLLFPTGYLTG